MIIVEKNTTATIKMYLRGASSTQPEGDTLINEYAERVSDDSGSMEGLSCISTAMYQFDLEVISEDGRATTIDSDISGTFDDFRRLLTFSLNTSNLSAESFYIVKVWEAGKLKLLSQDKMYIMPSGASVSTYQPKLTTTDRTMDNEFIIYGE
jgi:hypothetical protein